MWFMHDFGGWGLLFGGILMFIFWGGLIALIAWGIIRLTRRDCPITKSTPLDTVRERYAKGEINKEQFEQFKKDLH